jgi:hypothetical protein
MAQAKSVKAGCGQALPANAGASTAAITANTPSGSPCRKERPINTPAHAASRSSAVVASAMP